MKKSICTLTIFISALYSSQESQSRLKISFFDGIAVSGYVDRGAFVNFTGPNINFSNKGMKVMLGMLPSLRVKKDRSSGTRNSSVIPTLGVGFGVVYKKIVLQIPLYYNTKTVTNDGNWKVGVGIGYDFK